MGVDAKLAVVYKKEEFGSFVILMRLKTNRSI